MIKERKVCRKLFKKTSDERTGKILRTIANSISPMIRMEEDYPSNLTNNRLPILDLEVCVELPLEGELIMHQFFRKPIASRKVVQTKSTFSTAKKRSILLSSVGQSRLSF